MRGHSSGGLCGSALSVDLAETGRAPSATAAGVGGDRGPLLSDPGTRGEEGGSCSRRAEEALTQTVRTAQMCKCFKTNKPGGEKRKISNNCKKPRDVFLHSQNTKVNSITFIAHISAGSGGNSPLDAPLFPR